MFLSLNQCAKDKTSSSKGDEEGPSPYKLRITTKKIAASSMSAKKVSPLKDNGLNGNDSNRDRT